MGNVETAHSILVKVDHTPPVVTIQGVADGARYMLGGVPVPGFVAADATSGVASQSANLTGPGTASGAGSSAYSVTVIDNAGNPITLTARYQVDYFFAAVGGLLSATAVNVAQPLTVTLQLQDSGGAFIGSAVATLLVDGAPATPNGTFNTGDLFRYNAAGTSYIYKLSTVGRAVGIHVLTIVLDDGTRRQVSFAVGVRQPPALTVLPATSMTGASVTVSGSGYAPVSTVTLRLNGIVLGTAVVSSAGSFSFSMVLAATAPLGLDTVTASGVTPAGAAQVETGYTRLTS